MCLHGVGFLETLPLLPWVLYPSPAQVRAAFSPACFTVQPGGMIQVPEPPCQLELASSLLQQLELANSLLLSA